MQQRKKLLVGFTTIVLSSTLAFGAIVSAAGNEEGGSGRKQLSTDDKCDKIDEVRARAAGIQERIAQRIPVLQEGRAEAQANGDTERVERIERRLARLHKISTRWSERLTKIETWATTNCAA